MSEFRHIQWFSQTLKIILPQHGIDRRGRMKTIWQGRRAYNRNNLHFYWHIEFGLLFIVFNSGISGVIDEQDGCIAIDVVLKRYRDRSFDRLNFNIYSSILQTINRTYILSHLINISNVP